jgi:uncharacterized protein (TIGR03067 family)
MRNLIASFLLFSLFTVFAVAGGEKKAAPKIEGTWSATGGSSEGKKVPDDLIAKAMFVGVFKDGKYKVSVMGKDLETGTYKVDVSKKPATIDLTAADGKDEGKTQLGIFIIEGDKLTIAVGKADSKDRPKSFEGGDGVEVMLMTRNK